MLRWIRVNWLPISAGLLLVASLWLLWPAVVSAAFQKCTETRELWGAYQKLRETPFLPTLLYVWIDLRVACGLHVANGYRDALTAFSGLAVAAFTATLWWATLGMLRASRSQLEAIRKQGTFAERALVSAERAFVFYDKVDLTAALHPNGSVSAWTIVPGWKNSGTTPARHVVCHVSLHYQSGMAGLRDGFDFPEQWDIGEPGISMVSIPPQGTIGDSVKRIPIAELVASKQKTKRVFMYGWVEYDDVFPETPRHRTEFCVEIITCFDPRIDIGSLPQERRPKPFQFNFHGRHNGAEDECYRRPKSPEVRLAELRESRQNALAPRAGDVVRPEHDEFLPASPPPPE